MIGTTLRLQYYTPESPEGDIKTFPKSEIIFHL